MIQALGTSRFSGAKLSNGVNIATVKARMNGDKAASMAFYKVCIGQDHNGKETQTIRHI